MPKIQKFQIPTSGDIQYNPLTPAQWWAKKTTDYLGGNLGNPSLSSSLVNKSNPLFKTGKYDSSAVANTIKQATDFKFTTPSMESSVSAALTADPVSSAVKEEGKGFFAKLGGAKGIGAFGKKNAQAIGEAPAAIEAGMKLIGAKEATTASGGEQLFSQATSAAFKGALKTGNPIAIGVTGALKGLDMLNRYAGSTAEKQGTIGIDTGAYTTQISQNAGAKQTLLGSIGWRGKKSSKTATFNKQTKAADRSNLLASRSAYGNKQNQIAAENTAQDISSQNQQKLAGGINPYLLSAKKGAKINPKKLSTIKKKAQYKVRKAQEGSEVDDGQKFALGGKINVIPEGALHARKNNYEGELAEQVTSKGIPVITYDEDDKITQHAEIEHSEIIFNKDVTDQLEAWFKEYNETSKSVDKAELEIKCGKFLTEEILENTEDNVGLIEQV